MGERHPRDLWKCLQRSNQKPKCCHTQRTQELDRHQEESTTILLTVPHCFLCLWGQERTQLFGCSLWSLWVFARELCPLVWLSLYFCCIFCGCEVFLLVLKVGNTGDDLGPCHSLLWSEVPVCWPFLFWTQVLSGLWPPLSTSSPL